jgi:hypothetical protein
LKKIVVVIQVVRTRNRVSRDNLGVPDRAGAVPE